MEHDYCQTALRIVSRCPHVTQKLDFIKPYLLHIENTIKTTTHS